MPALETFAPDTPPETLAAALRRDGAIIVRDVMPAGLREKLTAEITPYVEATPNGRDEFTGALTTRTGALVARSPATRELLQHPTILALCDAILKPNCERYQLHLTQVIRIRPGQPAQQIHRDRWAWGTFLKDIEPQLNTIWAVTDFTQANGATQVAPGSTLWPDDRLPTPDEIGYAEMSAGSVLVYLGSVFHGGGANTADHDRIGLNLTYTLGWLRQEENQYLSCPPDIARTLSPALQGLIGYAMGSYALGYYTPPLPPGAGPEVVPPDFALGGDAEAGFGGSALLDALREKVAG
ncbi:phytanoyl-CoA dioxygenase [alpha proteobacterium AAP81b]|nr:phytanoyl-CoA dioxygenase [alpha proteobacterium AAP81b]